MFDLKKMLACILMCAIVASNNLFVFANSNDCRDLFIDGVNYTITESIDSDGNKSVLVVGAGEKVLVINDGKSLGLTIQDGNNNSSSLNINLEDDLSSVNENDTGVFKKSLYWNYEYYYDTQILPLSGMYWHLHSGDDNGVWHGYDENNLSARDYAYEFCSNVRDLDDKQWIASSESGACAASIAAAIAAAGPTAGVAAIVGIVAAVISGGMAVSEWVAAYNASLNCNESFVIFKQSL